MATVLSYTNGLIRDGVRIHCREQLDRVRGDHALVIVSPDFPGTDCQWVQVPYLPPWSPRSVYIAILAGLKAIPAGEYVAFAEHDCLVPTDWFSEPRCLPGQIAYGQSILRLNESGWFDYNEPGPKPGMTMLSCLSGYRDDLLAIFTQRLAAIESGTKTFPWAEPDELPWTRWTHPAPMIDVRGTGTNTTGTRTARRYSPTHEYWGNAATHIEAMKLGKPAPRNLHRAYLVKTAVCGDYTKRFCNPALNLRSDLCDYRLFTDGHNQALNVTDMQPYKVIVEPRREDLTPRQASRLHKMESESDYAWTIWHDDNVTLEQPEQLIADCQELPGDIFLFRHNHRRDLYEEAAFLIQTKVITGSQAEALNIKIAEYKATGMPHQTGLWELGLFVIRNSHRMTCFMEAWKAEYQAQGYERDQVCFAAMLWRFQNLIRPAKLQGSAYSNAYSRFHTRPHIEAK